MNLRILASVAVALAMTGCKAVDGLYEPGCAMHAGDRIRLASGTATWDRFSDEIRLDAAGNRVDPFPGYPRIGPYEIADGKLTIHFADNGGSAEFHLHDAADGPWLLTESEYAAMRQSGRPDRCALRRRTQD